MLRKPKAGEKIAIFTPARSSLNRALSKNRLRLEPAEADMLRNDEVNETDPAMGYAELCSFDEADERLLFSGWVIYPSTQNSTNLLISILSGPAGNDEIALETEQFESKVIFYRRHDAEEANENASGFCISIKIHSVPDYLSKNSFAGGVVFPNGALVRPAANFQIVDSAKHLSHLKPLIGSLPVEKIGKYWKNILEAEYYSNEHIGSSPLSLIEFSGLFDLAYYNEQAGKKFKLHDAIKNYLTEGEEIGLRPNRSFSAEEYNRLQSASEDTENAFVKSIKNAFPVYEIDKGLLGQFETKDIYRGIGNLNGLALYSSSDYLELNTDIKSASIDVSNHAFCFGFPEGRHVLKKERVVRSLGLAAQITDLEPRFYTPPKDTKDEIGIFYNSAGNIFLKEIAESLVRSIQLAGGRALLLDETADVERRPNLCIFVGPHEFFHLGAGSKWINSDVVSSSLMYNTEQPQTIWFERGLPFILMSKGVVDLSFQLHKIFEKTGLASLHFNPGVEGKSEWLLPEDYKHPLVKVLPTHHQPDDFSTRPIDICFFGNSSANREVFFSKHAEYLSSYDCYLYYRRFTTPLTSGMRDGLLGRLAGHVSTQSKIALNIHRDDIGFFEWHRIVQLGMAGGAVVVSEPCLPHPIYRPQIHYFEETGRHIPNLIDWLLRSDEGKAKCAEIRSNVSRIFSDSFNLNKSNTNLVGFIQSVLRTEDA